MIDVRLWRLVVEAHPVIQGQPRGNAPVVLDVPLHVVVLCIEHRPGSGLRVAVDITQQPVGITVIGVIQAIIGVWTEVEIALVGRSGGLNLVVLLEIDTGFEAVLADHLAQVVRERPDGVEVFIVAGGRPHAREVHGRAAAYRAELELRQEIEVSVGGRSTARIGGRNGKERRNIGNQRAILALPTVGGVVGPRIPTLAYREFVDQGGRDSIGCRSRIAVARIRVVDRRDSGLSQRSAYVTAELRALIQRGLVVMIVDIADIRRELRRGVEIHAKHVIPPGMGSAGGFEIVGNVGLRTGPGEIGQGEEVQHRLAQCGDAGGGNNVPRECHVAVRGVDDGEQGAVVLQGLREIALTFQGRRRVFGLRTTRDELAGILLRPEEEELVLG